MEIKVTYYLDVISSWCYWAEPAWSELRRRYANVVEFDWRIALIDTSGLPQTQAEEEWYYRRSGTILRSRFMLNAEWLEPGLSEYLAPNAVAEAARDLGASDDRVRLALAEAAVRQGLKVGRWEIAAEVGAAAGGLDPADLLQRARSPEIESRIRKSTADFRQLQVTQRPTFVIDDEIGDRAVFSGLVRYDPLQATIENMLEDCMAYASWKAHFGTWTGA